MSALLLTGIAIAGVLTGFIMSLVVVDVLDRPGKGRHSR